MTDSIRNTPIRLALALGIALGLAGCATLEPRLPDADAAIPATWPLPPVTAALPAAGDSAADTAVADVGWRDFFVDADLEALIAHALENNRDLRVAMLNVDRARAQYRIQRADRVPAVGLGADLTRSGNDAGVTDLYSVDLGVTAFELDLFGRVRSLSAAALQDYLATEEAQRGAQLALVAEVASAYLTLSADLERERLARATLDSHQASFELTERRHALGAVSSLDVNQARTVVESARVDAARYAGLVAQDRNALALLIGGSVAPDLWPETFAPDVSGIAPLPAGLPSEVLLRRPDVRQTEHTLLAANANIGAARAAFFPSIRLTGSIGSASDELGGLFESGTRVWSFLPQISLPIFQGGKLRAALDVAKIDRDIALAQYEKSIQAGFRDVADALALAQTLDQQLDAQQALLDAATKAQDLSQSRYESGLDSYLVLLDAQRTRYAAAQALIGTQLAQQTNRIGLYKALGGGWQETSP